ncbi:uncharacterized protein LOC105278736 isoform X1 [Ooceraea biroi]|uniref:uncharacterized protein LOC105278736 isoform X1 n=2 Tax=Ooceraea biroi TaxID=2015173 RepID=UPI00097161F2|nr:uncharacterized protein LOC105278736 isoform X1 [Ooceraea biroi]
MGSKSVRICISICSRCLTSLKYVTCIHKVSSIADCFSQLLQMPYILVRGNLASYGHKYPWRVLVSGLKAADIEQLSRFSSGGYCDDSTIVYMQHPCVLLTALEVLGYKVVASSSTSVKQDYNEYMWTMRKEFSEPEPDTVVKAARQWQKQPRPTPRPKSWTPPSRTMKFSITSV